jgi:copper chaperone CopZ
MNTQTYTVVGMTCGHCVSSVGAELGALPGVTDVNVDLATGQVAVTADELVTDQQVRGAVEEAGFTFAS